MSRLTEKQRKFVEAYIGKANGNGRLAAELAGYQGDENQLAVTASRNLRKDKIRKALADRLNDCELAASREALIEYWSRIVFGFDEATHSERLRASELLAKFYGLFVDRIEHSGDLTYTVDFAGAIDLEDQVDE